MVWDLTHPHTHANTACSQTHTHRHMPLVLIAPLLHISDVSKFCTCSRDSHFCFAHHMIKEVIWYHLAVGNMNGDMPPTVLLSVSLCLGAKAYKRKSVQWISFCCLIKFKQPNMTLWVLRTVILGVCKPNSIMIMSLPVKEDKDNSEYTEMDIYIYFTLLSSTMQGYKWTPLHWNVYCCLGSIKGLKLNRLIVTNWCGHSAGDLMLNKHCKQFMRFGVMQTWWTGAR